MRAAVVGHVEWVDFVRVEHVPLPGEIIHAQDAWRESGGGGAGAAVQLYKLTGDTVFFTALGDDQLGHRAHTELTRLGVRLEAVFRPDRTRRALTHVDGTGERTITVIGERLGPAGSDPLPWEQLEQVDVCYFTAGDVAALRRARRARVLVATARVLPLLQAARVELDAVVGSAHDPAETFRGDDVEPRPRLCVWTDGERGGSFQSAGSQPVRYPAAPLQAPISDRYGAGDSFAAGLAFALGAGHSAADAVGFAARCGAAVLTGRGPYEGQLRQPRAGG